MPRSVMLSGGDFVKRYGGRVCVMPDPAVTVAVVTRVRGERWLDAAGLMLAHLRQGVTLVVFLDEPTRTLAVFRDDTAPKQFGPETSLTIPDVLPGFSVAAGKFFE